MKIIKNSPQSFVDFKKEENSNSVAFIETKENSYFIRFDVLDDFLDFAKEISLKEPLSHSYYPGLNTLKTVCKKEVIEYKNNIKKTLSNNHLSYLSN